MTEFEDMKASLLESSSGLSKADIESMIDRKIEKIGAGYLTPQGALFLVAQDLGIRLSEPLTTQTEIKDLYAGAKDVTILARLMSMSQSREYTRRDGTPFKLRTMTIYDAGGSCTAKLWDDVANLPILDKLSFGDAIKIKGAYIKSDLGGIHNVNLGESSNLEKIDDLPDVPGVDAIAKDVGSLTEMDRDVVVTGQLDGMVSVMNFTTRDRPGRALRMRIRGDDGISHRVVLWGKDDSGIPKVVKPDTTVTLLGVRGKQTNQGLEVHGSESTGVIIPGSNEAQPLTLRILSMSEGERGGTMLLCVDTDRTMYFVMDAAAHCGECQDGDVVECMPTTSYGKSVTLNQDAYLRRLEDDDAIPRLSNMKTRLEDARPGGDYCVEVVVLQPPEMRDIQTRSGETIQLSELFVGDDSGEIKIKGWRRQARLANSCKIGERYVITGINGRQGLDGSTDLMLTAYSTITSISDPKIP